MGIKIPNQSDMHAHLQQVELVAANPVRRLIYQTLRAKRRQSNQEALKAPLPTPSPLVLHFHEDFYREDPGGRVDEATQEY